jgi:hypothetical protein
MNIQGVLSRLGRWTGRVVLGAAVVAFALASVTGVARANSITYDLTQDNCTGGCNPGSGSMGTILLTDNGTNDVQVTITLVSPLDFMSSGLDATIGFNLTGIGTGVSAVNFSNSNFVLASGTADSLHMDGFGDFDYGIDLTTGNGAVNAVDASPLTFDITCASCGLSIGSFAELSTGPGSDPAYFAVDVYNSSPSNGNTGAIGAVDPGTPGTVVPEASTISLLGTGLLALFGLGLYRRWSTSV